MNPLDRLQKVLAYRFIDQAMLERALTHRSAGRDNYERLEFLGDGLLNFVIGATLYEQAQDAGEGDLSRLRASLVRESTLAAIASDLGLGDHVRLGAGELRSGGFRRRSILADVVESLIGACYLDGGFEAARDLILRLYLPRLQDLPDAETLKDAKTRLQEILQGQGRPLPTYETLGSEGPPHKQVFTVACCLGDEALSCEATGSSRRKAEQNAARAMIERLQENA